MGPTALDLCRPNDIAQGDAYRLILRYAVPFFRRYLPDERQLVKQVPGVMVTAEPRRDAQ